MAEFDRQKFKELLLYVAEKSEDDPRFGATKLNKILFFAEFLAYLNFGRPIAGATYQRLSQGPAPRELLPVRGEMLEDGELHIDRRVYFGFPQDRLTPNRKPDLSSFTPDEIALIDAVIEWLRGMGAVDVSELSHRLALGWQLASPGQEIPYQAAFLSADDPTENDMLAGKRLAAERGWSTP